MKTIHRRIASVVLVIMGLSMVAVPTFADTTNVSVWWPTDGVTIAATQPFKALIDNKPLGDYSMYWQVDNGQLNAMSDNMTGYPHKEASVDVSGWHWNTSGAYKINFVAKDTSGNMIAQKSMTIYAYANKPSGTTPAPQPTPTPTPVVTPPSSGGSTTVTPPVQSATENIWWPTDGVTMTGVQPLKARIENMNLSSYKMYWQVDNGQLNLMNDNTVGGDHKEALADVTNWNWKGTGPYVLNFVAKDNSGNIMSQKSVSFKVGAQTTTSNPPTSTTGGNTSGSTSGTTTTPPATTTNPTPTPTPDPTPLPVVSGNPLSGLSLYVNPNNDAQTQYNNWISSRPADAQQMLKIANNPVAVWLGDWNTNVYGDVKSLVDAASAKNQVPVMIAYDIPNRDCNGYSAGGASSGSAYMTWINNIASGIGNRKAVVILEPDSLAMLDCLSSSDQATRLSLINQAITKLKSNANTIVYVDAANSNWVAASTMAQRLKSAGIANADGFAVNVSNFYWTSDAVNYGNAVSSQVGNKHFVIDTSRNGQGPDGGNWCNPSGRGLGKQPTTNTGNSLVDAFLWLKTPGESDGQCNGGPAAGVWWPEYALGIAQRSAF